MNDYGNIYFAGRSYNTIGSNDGGSMLFSSLSEARKGL